MNMKFRQFRSFSLLWEESSVLFFSPNRPYKPVRYPTNVISNTSDYISMKNLSKFHVFPHVTNNNITRSGPTATIIVVTTTQRRSFSTFPKTSSRIFHFFKLFVSAPQYLSIYLFSRYFWSCSIRIWRRNRKSALCKSFLERYSIISNSVFVQSRTNYRMCKYVDVEIFYNILLRLRRE